MIHFKSKSSQIKEESNKEKEQPNLNAEYLSTTVNQIDSTKDNLSLNLTTGENIGKILSLSEQDNDDKIVNISKLEESLCYTGRNTKREKKEMEEEQYQNAKSDYELIIRDAIKFDENNISKPIINISYLDSQENKNKTTDITNQINVSKINIKENNNKKVMNNVDKKDEVFLFKKRRKIFSKKIIILSLIIFLIIFLIFSIICIKRIFT